MYLNYIYRDCLSKSRSSLIFDLGDRICSTWCLPAGVTHTAPVVLKDVECSTAILSVYLKNIKVCKFIKEQYHQQDFEFIKMQPFMYSDDVRKHFLSDQMRDFSDMGRLLVNL